MVKAISNKYIVVRKHTKEKQDGFQAIDVQDDFVYKGVVVRIPEIPVYIDNEQIGIGDTVYFCKYSPDTHEIDGEKYVKIEDLLALGME